MSNEKDEQQEPQGIDALGNPWDRAYAPGEHPPDPLSPRNRLPEPPVGESHIGRMSDPTPREQYTVAGQVAQTQADGNPEADEQPEEADQ